MPATVISQTETEPTALSQFMVVGMYDRVGSKFVRHVGLVRTNVSAIFGKYIRVWHMGPPLVAGEQAIARAGRDTGFFNVHVVGWVALSADEQAGITHWLAQMETQLVPTDTSDLMDGYTVSLDSKDHWKYDENGQPLYPRFNCVSFVLSAFKLGAEIDLVSTSELPSIPMQALARAYPVEQLSDPEFRERIQLVEETRSDGSSSCSILMAGYVIHALNKSDDDVRKSPHVVASVDECNFPN